MMLRTVKNSIDVHLSLETSCRMSTFVKHSVLVPDLRPSELSLQPSLSLVMIRSRRHRRPRHRYKLKVGCPIVFHSSVISQSGTHLKLSPQVLKRCHHVPLSPSSTSTASLRLTPCLPFALSSPASHCRHCFRAQSTVIASSGEPSPQGSFNFSQNGSISSRSTPSSQSSYSELSTPPPVNYVRRHPRIQVSSLLADPHPRSALIILPEFNYHANYHSIRSYHLEVVQHPQRTAEFAQASLSRLPLTPPIVARLIVRDPSGNSVIPYVTHTILLTVLNQKASARLITIFASEAELPFLVAHLSLFSADGLTPLDMGVGPTGAQNSSPQRLLYGNLVSSVYKLEDLQGNMGLFFLFPDVSIRWRGRFQLSVTLMRLSRRVISASCRVIYREKILTVGLVYNRTDSSGAMSVGEHGIVLAEARTRPFDVLAHSQYTAARVCQLCSFSLLTG